MSGERVFITSCETGEGAWRGLEWRLKQLYELSDKRYRLTDDPGEADVILIGDVRSEGWGRGILKNPLVNRFPSKSFSLSVQDGPTFLHHGLYSSSKRSFLSLGRVRTGAYTTRPENRTNPYVLAHESLAPDFSEKQYLLTFVGRASSPIRHAIFALRFRRQDIYVEDSSRLYNLWNSITTDTKKDERERYYYDMLLRSKFSLCPRGGGTGSIRLFESMKLGVAPVIVADGWIPPRGPQWDSFSIVVKEKEIRDLERIVEWHEGRYAEMGLLAARAYQEYFSEAVYFNYVVDNCLEMLHGQRVPETIYWKLAPAIVLAARVRDRVRRHTRGRGIRSRIKGLLTARNAARTRRATRGPWPRERKK